VVCKAAIHAGVIQSIGGMIEFIKKEGQDQYPSAVNRGVESVSYDKWKYSFVISKPISEHIARSISFAKKP